MVEFKLLPVQSKPESEERKTPRKIGIRVRIKESDERITRLYRVKKNLLAKGLEFYCNNCDRKLDYGELYVRKHKKSHTNKYCLNCSIILNILTEKDIIIHLNKASPISPYDILTFNNHR